MPFYSPRTCPQRGQTSITHASRGFDFLGFNIRRYPNGKLLIKPSTAAIKRIRKRLREVFQTMLGASARELIQTLNPIISGWAAYYRTAVSSGAFSLLDDYVWKLALKWATRRYRNKPKRWIADRYFGRFHPHRKDRWVLGDRDSGVYLQRFSWTRIVRHQLVTGGASPDDPALADYWARRRRKQQPPLGEYALYQLQRQHGRCPLCGDYLLHVDHAPTSTEEWAQWFRVSHKAISKHSLKIVGSAEPGTPDRNRIHLVHTRCRRLDPRGGTGPALLRSGAQPTRLA